MDSSGTGKGRDDGDWSCFIEVDANEIESLVKHLKRHKLRSKVTIRIVEEGEWEVFAAWNDSKPPSSNSSIQAVPDPSEQITFTDPRVPNFGHRILLSAPSSASKEEALARSHLPESLPESELSYYTLRRYLHGIPEGQAEIIREQALPQESDIDFMNGIDFRKGCYVGQELTIRTHHTGVVRKRILPVQLYRTGNGMPERLEYDKDWMGGVPAAGTNIKKVEGKGRSTGKFLAGIGNVGLALCRLEMMTDVRLTAEGGTYKEGDEFAVEVQKGGKETRIKPFVPVWMRDKLHMRDAPRRVE